MAYIPMNENGGVSKDLTLASLHNLDKSNISFQDSIILQPGVYFAAYNEDIGLEDGQSGMIDGKSSLSRLGFQLTRTESTFLLPKSQKSPLFFRTLYPMKIYKDMQIGQLLVDDHTIPLEEINQDGGITIDSDEPKLTLGKALYTYLLPQGAYLDPREDNSRFLNEIEIPDGGLELRPLTLYLGLTNERVIVSNGVARVSVPLMKENSEPMLVAVDHAAFIKDGFDGKIALEIGSYVEGAKIYPNMEIASLDSLGPTTKSCVPEKSKYIGQETPIQIK